METDNNLLDGNRFYVVVADAGYVFKTRFKNDFDEVRSWSTVIFSGIVSNSKSVHYRIGSSIYSKKLSLIAPAKSYEDLFFYEIWDLPMHGGNHINKIWIGGKDETPEPL